MHESFTAAFTTAASAKDTSKEVADAFRALEDLQRELKMRIAKLEEKSKK